MSKRPSLAASRHDAGADPALSFVSTDAVPPKAGLELELTVTARTLSRVGLPAVACFVSPEAHKKLRIRGQEGEASVQNLMTEVLNDLFRKYGRTLIT